MSNQPQKPQPSSQPLAQSTNQLGLTDVAKKPELVEQALRDQIEVEKAALLEVIDSHVKNLQIVLSPEYDKVKRMMVDVRNAEDRVLFRQRQIRELEERYVAEENKYKGRIALAESKLKAIAAEYPERFKEVAALKESVAQHKQVLKDLGFEAKQAQEQIRDRRAYLNEQEDIIAKALDEGNQQLKSKRQELEEVKLEQEEYLRQKMLAEGEMYQANRDREATQKKLKDIQATYEEKAAELRASLGEIQRQSQEAAAKHRTILIDVEAKLAELNVKEKELASKSDIMQKAQIDLNRKQRKLESDQALYSSR